MPRKEVSNNKSYLTESDLLILECLLNSDKPLLKGKIVKECGTAQKIGIRLNHLNKFSLIVKPEKYTCRGGCKISLNREMELEVRTILKIFRKKSR
jgi:hypothetical protein